MKATFLFEYQTHFPLDTVTEMPYRPLSKDLFQKVSCPRVTLSVVIKINFLYKMRSTRDILNLSSHILPCDEILTVF